MLVTAGMGRAPRRLTQACFLGPCICPCGHQLPAVAFAGTRMSWPWGRQTATEEDTLLSVEWRCPVSPVQPRPRKGSGHERDVRQCLRQTVTFSVFVSGLSTDRFSLRTESPGWASQACCGHPHTGPCPIVACNAGSGPAGTCQ